MINYGLIYPPKREGVWLCNNCARHMNYGQQIWGSPQKSCQWCGRVEMLKLYYQPFKPRIGPAVEMSVG